MQLSEKDGWYLPKPDERRDRLAAARVLERELDHLHRPSRRRTRILEARRLCLTMIMPLLGYKRRLDRKRGTGAVQINGRMSFRLERVEPSPEHVAFSDRVHRAATTAMLKVVGGLALIESQPG